MGGLACKMARVDWEPDTFVGFDFPRGMRRPGNGLAIATTISTKYGYLDRIVDLDGPTRFAMLQKDPQNCRLAAFSGLGERFGYAMRTAIDGTPTQDALIGGELVDGKPRILQAYKEPDLRTLRMGDDGYIENEGPLTVVDWATGKRGETIYSPNGSALYNPTHHKGIVSFETGSGTRGSLWTYTRSNKAEVFRSFRRRRDPRGGRPEHRWRRLGLVGGVWKGAGHGRLLPACPAHDREGHPRTGRPAGEPP